MDLLALDRELLAAWRETRHPEIAARLRRLAALAHESAPTVLAWDHPASLHRRATMPQKRPFVPNHLLHHRLDTRAPDPRIADWLLQLLEQVRYAPYEEWGADRGATTQVLEHLAQHASHEMLPRLREAVRLPPMIAPFLASWGVPPEPLSPEMRRRLEAIDASFDSFASAVSATMSLRAERPLDDTRLDGLPDDDPLREFLPLQRLHASGGGDATSRTREARLLAKWSASWFPDVACAHAPKWSRCRGGRLFRMGLDAPRGVPVHLVVRQPSFESVREVVLLRGAERVLHRLPQTIEAVWNVPPSSNALYATFLRRFRRVGFEEPASWLAGWLRDCSSAEVLALDGHDLNSFLRIEERGKARDVPSIPTLCAGRGKRTLDEMRALFSQWASSLDARGVRVIRIARTALDAWDAPEETIERAASRATLSSR